MRISIKTGRNRLIAAAAGILLAGSAVAAVAVTPATAAVGVVTVDAIANQSTTPLGSVVTPVQVTETDTDATAGLLVYSATGLPAGVTIDGATGLISGIATAAVAASNVIVSVTDSDNNVGTTAFTWTTKNTITVTKPANQTTPLDTKNVILPVNAASNGVAALKYVAPGLPNGLVINNATGTITGETLKAGTFVVTLTVSDNTASPAATTTFTWTVGNTVTVKAPAAEKSSVGAKITPVTITSTDSAAGEKFSYAAANLPKGLTMTAAGVISGTPTTAGTSATVITATDTDGSTGTATIQWTVGAQKTAVKVTAPVTKTVYLGVKVSIALKATDSNPALKTFTYSSSALPRGLSLNKATGVISGRPTNSGTKKTTFAAKDANGSAGTAVITFKIRGAVAVVDLMPRVKSAVAGQGLDIQFTATDAVKGDSRSCSGAGRPRRAATPRWSTRKASSARRPSRRSR
jgi:hypothetical protein